MLPFHIESNANVLLTRNIKLWIRPTTTTLKTTKKELLFMLFRCRFFLSKSNDACLYCSTLQIAYYTFFLNKLRMLCLLPLFHFIFNIQAFFASRCNNCNHTIWMCILFLSFIHNQISSLDFVVLQQTFSNTHFKLNENSSFCCR